MEQALDHSNVTPRCGKHERRVVVFVGMHKVKRCVRKRNLRAALELEQLGYNAVVTEKGSDRERTVAVAVDGVLVDVRAKKSLTAAKRQVKWHHHTVQETHARAACTLTVSSQPLAHARCSAVFRSCVVCSSLSTSGFDSKYSTTAV